VLSEILHGLVELGKVYRREGEERLLNYEATNKIFRAKSLTKKVTNSK